MDYGMPFAWEEGRRGFWTRRRRAGMSLMTVLALIAGLAVAFKFFEQEVDNNVIRDAAVFDFEVWKWDEILDGEKPDGTPEFEEAGSGTPVFESGVQTYPGDARKVDVKIVNTNVNPARDASFAAWAVNLRVQKCEDVGNDGNINNDFNADGSCTGVANGDSNNIDVVNPADLDWNKFVNYWTLQVNKEKILVANPPGTELNEDDHQGQNLLTGASSDPDASGNRQYDLACEGGLKTFTQNAPCRLGIVRSVGSTDALGGPTDIRYFEFFLKEIDDNSNQSRFRGWTLAFDLVFAAQVPALPEPTTPVHER